MLRSPKLHAPCSLVQPSSSATGARRISAAPAFKGTYGPWEQPRAIEPLKRRVQYVVYGESLIQYATKFSKRRLNDPTAHRRQTSKVPSHTMFSVAPHGQTHSACRYGPQREPLARPAEKPQTCGSTR